MPAPLTEETRQAVARLRARNRSMREIAAELGISVGAVHELCSASRPKAAGGARNISRANDGRRDPPRSPAGQPPGSPPQRRDPGAQADAAPSEEPDDDDLQSCVEEEGGDPDLGQLTMQIRRAERYLKTLRATAAGPTSVIQTERLLADLAERRRKLRPPPPPTEEDEVAKRRRDRTDVLQKVQNLIEAAEQESAERASQARA